MEEGEGDGWELLGRRAVACHTIRREGEGDSGDCRWRTNWSTLFIWRPPPAAAVPAASMSMWKCQGDGLTQVKDAGGSIKRRPQCFADRTASVLYKHEGRNVALFLSCDLLSLHPHRLYATSLYCVSCTPHSTTICMIRRLASSSQRPH